AAAPTAPPQAPQPAPSAPAAAPAAAPAGSDVAAGAGEELYRFNTIRKAIARHMLESVQTTAQLTSIVEVDMTAIVNYRRELKPIFAERYGVNLTFLPFIMKATIDAIGRW